MAQIFINFQGYYGCFSSARLKTRIILMKNFITALTAVLLIMATACSNESDQRQAESVQPDGNEHAAIVENAVFTDLDGNDVNISEFEGKLVLIDFWESWCGPCLQVFPAMEDLRGEYPDQFEVLAVTVGMTEGPEDARAFKEEHGYDFHFLYDEYGVFQDLGGTGIPFKAYVGPDGKFIKIEMGSRGRQGDYNTTKQLISEQFNQ